MWTTNLKEYPKLFTESGRLVWGSVSDFWELSFKNSGATIRSGALGPHELVATVTIITPNMPGGHKAEGQMGKTLWSVIPELKPQLWDFSTRPQFAYL